MKKMKNSEVDSTLAVCLLYSGTFFKYLYFVFLLWKVILDNILIFTSLHFVNKLDLFLTLDELRWL